MEAVKTVIKDKLNIDEKDINEYLAKNRLRIIVSLVVFAVELLFLFMAIRTTNWKSRGFFGRTYCLLWIAIGMVVFEAVRYIDPVIKKKLSKKR